MKIEWKSCLKIVISLFLLFLGIHYWGAFSQLIILFFSGCSPLFIGAIIAYLVNILMSFYEKHYFPKSQNPKVIKSKRGVCLIASIITLLGIVYLIISLIIPELISCVKLLGKSIPQSINGLINIINQNDSLATFIPEDFKTTLVSVDWQDFVSKVAKVITSGFSDVIETIAVALSSALSIAMTSLISVIFAIYLLLDKNKLINQCHRLMRIYLKPSWNQKIIYVVRILNDSFHRFIVGQCIEAVILGVLCAIGMIILRLPYAAMIGAFIGFTALIPVAGAYIGGAVGVLMILTVSPMQAIIFLIFLCLLQQFEENLIYPRVVGASIGLSALWVLAAITIGGGVLGITGMFIGVPLAATIYQIIKDDVRKKEQIQSQT